MEISHENKQFGAAILTDDLSKAFACMRYNLGTYW